MYIYIYIYTYIGYLEPKKLAKLLDAMFRDHGPYQLE